MCYQCKRFLKRAVYNAAALQKRKNQAWLQKIVMGLFTVKLC